MAELVLVLLMAVSIALVVAACALPLPPEDEPMADESFTCPRCSRITHHPDDVREGFCGFCHDWTGLQVSRRESDESPQTEGQLDR